MNIVLSEGEVETFIAKFKGYLGYLVTARLSERCPVDKGFLRNSINFEITEQGITISMADYGKYVEFGTAPHIIKAKNGQALKFEMNGKTVFAKSVVHPGTRPNPFIRTTFFQDLSGLAEQAAVAALNDVRGVEA